VEQYVRLFEKFISENGRRAQKIPLTYMEIIGLWNTFIAPCPVKDMFVHVYFKLTTSIILSLTTHHFR
jgi:hypothetical protein